MGIPILDEKCDLSIIVDMTGVTAYCTTRTFYISAGGLSILLRFIIRG
jgi:hypothetical protein